MIQFLKAFKNFGIENHSKIWSINFLRASYWGSEFTLHADIPVTMGKINTFDREFSPLAPSVRALELNQVFISNGCVAFHCNPTVTIFPPF